ncbi:MAG: hypothetical protein V4568_01805 [Pseudomonadota bacterium]
MEQMHNHMHCRFCSISEGNTFNGAADIPIDASSDYFSIASIGAIIEGWTLVVPRRHCLSLRGLYGSEEFSRFVDHLVAKVEAIYGAVTIFEHGANHNSSPTSCGTDHAHLHVVPIGFSLRALVETSNLAPWHLINASEINGCTNGAEYLFFSEHPQNKDPKGYLHVLEQPRSQFFRALIANAIGKPHLSDYKIHSLLDTAERTNKRLSTVG